MSNLNMPVKYCKDENDNEFSPVVYQESMFNDDGTRMDPVPRKMFAKAYDPTKTYPTENLFCIQDNKYYKFTGSGTTTGTFDPTKWTETDDATELTALNSTLTNCMTGYGVITDNANNMFTLGIYRNTSSITNCPSSDSNGMLLVFPAYQSNDGLFTCFQVYVMSNGNIYTRINWAASSVSWTTWKLVTLT